MRSPAAAERHHVDVHVGKQLAALRLRLGFNQSEVGRMLGLTFQQVQKYEKGTNRMSASVLHTLAEKMKVDIGYFFEGLGTEGGTTVIQPASKAAIEIMDVVERMEPRQQRLLASLARELAPAEQQAA